MKKTVFKAILSGVKMRLISLFIVLCMPWIGSAKLPVLVSIAPQKFVVEQVGGDHVTVQMIVPVGASPHTYEPTPRQMLAAKSGKLWFRLGESFEDRLIPVLAGETVIIDQREGLDLIAASCQCCSKGSYDPHIWLSPRLLKLQAEQVAQVLSHIDPINAPLYQKNLQYFEQELDHLDQEIRKELTTKRRTVLVSHPAFGYFCRDYGFLQLSIEKEGKEATARSLTNLLKESVDHDIRTVFVSKQYSTKGALRLAQEIHACVIYLDPYAENVIENLREIARAFNQA